MGFRFRKRIKILPGLNLNLGLRGVSVSAGVPGLRFNLSKKGMSRTIGIPGTGLYHTERLSASPRRQTRKASTLSPVIKVVNLQELKTAAQTPGSVIRNLETGRKASATQIQAEIRRLENAQASAQAKQQIAHEEAQLEDLLNYWKDMPSIPSWDQYCEALNPLAFQTHLMAPTEPNQVTSQANHWTACQSEIGSKFPYKFLPRFIYKNVVQKRFDSTWEDSWNNNYSQYIAAVNRYNENISDEYSEWESTETTRTQFLHKMMSGELEAIIDGAEATIEAINFPFETECEIYTGDPLVLFLHLDLPEIEDVIPAHKKEVLKNGSIKEKKMAVKDRNEMYARLVLGHSVFVAASICSAVPYPQHVQISAYTQRARKKQSDPIDTYVFDLPLTRQSLADFDADKQDIIDFVTNQSPVMDLDDSFKLQAVEKPNWLSCIDT